MTSPTGVRRMKEVHKTMESYCCACEADLAQFSSFLEYLRENAKSCMILTEDAADSRNIKNNIISPIDSELAIIADSLPTPKKFAVYKAGRKKPVVIPYSYTRNENLDKALELLDKQIGKAVKKLGER